MEVGKVLKPQGIRGEIKVKPLTDDPSRFNALKSVEIGGVPYRITGVRVCLDGVYIKLDGVDDRNGAEKLRDKFLSIDRVAAAPLDDGAFYIADVLGAKLAVRGEESKEQIIGTITDVQSFGAADVFYVSLNSGGSMSFAFVKALCAVLDANNKVLSVDGAKLAEVAVYED